MRKMVLGAIVAAAAGSLLLGVGAAADPVLEGKTEIRVFVLDKSLQPVDVKNWTGAVDVTPERGQRRAFKLQPVATGSPEGVKEGVKEGARELKEGVKEGAKDLKGEGHQDHARTAGKDPMLCGQVKELDEWLVEMVVVRGGTDLPSTKGDDGRGDRDPQAKSGGKGFRHTHGGAYFKADLDEAAIKDAKTGVVKFDATVVFTLPNGDTKYVKGFEYPEGVIDDGLGRILDKDLKDPSKLDHDQAAAAARKIQAALQALPPLSFKDAEDRQEFEKAKQECMAACHRMEQASGKEISDAADKCKSALKELRSQAKDAQGALTAD